MKTKYIFTQERNHTAEKREKAAIIFPKHYLSCCMLKSCMFELIKKNATKNNLVASEN